MLTNIDDVLNFYEGQKDFHESIGDPYFCRSKGGDAIDADVAEALGLSPAYLNFCSVYELKGVQFGFVSFFQRNRASATVALVYMNKADAKLPALQGYVVIGNLEGDPVVFKQNASGACDDTVYVADISAGPNIRFFDVARSFEEFVIFAANVHAESLREKLLTVSDFESGLRGAFPDLPENQLGFWRDWFASSV